jgi:hypothetical protein
VDTHLNGDFENYPRKETLDQIVGIAELDLIKRFINVRREPIKTPFYLRQLQVFYERYYSDDITRKALNNLIKKGSLGIIRKKDFPRRNEINHIPDIVFYHNSQIKEREQDTLTQKAFRIAKIVNLYSDSSVTKSVGKHLEDLVACELRAQQFNIISKKSNEYNGQKWTGSGSNLDIIATHKVKNLKIGVEIKNSLNVISKKQLEEKIKICNFLGLTPVFAVRWLRPHIHLLKKSNGFAWIFETQIYPRGFNKLVKFIYRRLSIYSRKTNSIELKFPVTVSGDLPQNSISMFEDWIDTFT